MKNIIAKIKQVHPLSDEALNALVSEMEEKYYPKNTCIVHSGTTDRMVYFIEEGITRSVFHHDGNVPARQQELRDQARHDVGGAAGCRRDDDAGLRRWPPGLRSGDPRQRDQRCGQCGAA